jgi:PTS system nitrogen regulatory IIA component
MDPDSIMRLDTILSPSLTRCRAAATSKKRVLETAAQLISQQVGGLDGSTLFSNLIARERLGSTGLGEGIAIPHCRLQELDRAVGCLVTLEQPIEFEALDDQPVDILFVLVVPEQATQEHLDLLAGLAERFAQPAFRDQLRAADSDEALYQAAVAYNP